MKPRLLLIPIHIIKRLHYEQETRKSLIDKIIVSVEEIMKENNKKLTSQVETMFGKPIRQILKKSSKKVVVVEKH